MKDAVFCRCGASWHGVWVRKAENTIAIHRWRSRQTADSRCGLISHERYVELHRCKCDDCKAARILRRAAIKARLAANADALAEREKAK